MFLWNPLLGTALREFLPFSLEDIWQKHQTLRTGKGLLACLFFLHLIINTTLCTLLRDFTSSSAKCQEKKQRKTKSSIASPSC